MSGNIEKKYHFDTDMTDLWLVCTFAPTTDTINKFNDTILNVNDNKITCLFRQPTVYIFRYPADDFPVLAFSGAPASFPVEEKNWRLHQYVTWSPQIEELATEYVRTNMAEGESLGIHLRLGNDWVCLHLYVGIATGALWSINLMFSCKTLL